MEMKCRVNFCLRVLSINETMHLCLNSQSYKLIINICYIGNDCMEQWYLHRVSEAWQLLFRLYLFSASIPWNSFDHVHCKVKSIILTIYHIYILHTVEFHLSGLDGTRTSQDCQKSVINSFSCNMLFYYYLFFN